MPAAAVIPAPIVYCKVVVIKTLVVEFKEVELFWFSFKFVLDFVRMKIDLDGTLKFKFFTKREKGETFSFLL